MSKRYIIVFSLIYWILNSVVANSGTLSDTPLSLKATVPPNVLFALSVEYPTADTAAYQGASDYLPSNSYLGLFDPDKCYSYDTSNNWFYPPSSTLADNHACPSSNWSGNFLNWATMTGLDEFRFAMTGGNRYRDTATETVLERTYQDGQGTTSNFTDKSYNLSDADFVGAVPFSVSSITGTIVNQGKGVQMLVSASTPTTISCTAWKTTSPYNCLTFSMAYNPFGSTITCTSWSNDSTRKTCSSGSFDSSRNEETISSAACTSTTTSGGVSGHCSTYSVTYTANPWSGSNFYVRVKVCDSAVGLENNCKLYGTSYKPTGVLQDNGDKMRFGVFSYFKDNSINNAVMRSKLKYVAPQQYASSIGTVVNPNSEWSETDGTLFVNPDPTIASASYNGAVSNSGVINYINKFGSLGSSSTRYKSYDNVGKLYYEALAYLRKRTPDSTLYNGVTSSNNDQFPVITTWDDPILYSCQKNYIIAMGDTHTHCDKKLPGGAYTSAQNTCGQCTGDYGTLSNGDSVSVATWTNKIGTLEGVSMKPPTTTGAGCASYYMSGLAYYAKSTDIRPNDATKANTLGVQTAKTFVIDVQEYGDQGVNSQYWYAAKYGGADSYLANGTPQGWATDSSSSWPKTLLKAGDPASMIAAVQSAFQSIRAGIGVESALAQSSGDLRTAGGAYIYQAIFNSGGWVGDVQGYSIDSSGSVSSTVTWRATDWFTTHSANDRTLFSYNDGLKADGTADVGNTNAHLGIKLPSTSLTSLSLLSTRQQALLNRDEVGTTDNLGVARMNYLRGETTNEGLSGYRWRSRSGKIGDIVNSSPAYVADPLPGLIGPGYGAFRLAKAGRKPMLYVGSNDGFLRGFDASPPGTQGATPGAELMAYIPGAVYSQLSQLMSPNYAHKFYVDGNPVVGEACNATCPTDGSGWKTLLVGGLNAGGQGIYALNVTNPSSFGTVTGPNLVLWEFTDRDDKDLGYTFGEPTIKKMNNGRWAVIFGNGYNNTVSDGRVSDTGRAYLYILFVDGPTGTQSGAGKTWVLGTDYYKIELKASGDTYVTPNFAVNNPPNGLSAPVGVDKTLNGTVDLIYAGDRLGNLWKIDVSSATPSAWGVAFGTSSSPRPLFTAKDSSNNIQQITSSLEISKHPQGGYLAFFGTGSYIDITDPQPENGTSFNTQTFYGIWDKDNFTDLQRSGFSTITRSQLQGQKVVSTWLAEGDTFYIQSNCMPNYSSTTANTYQLQSDGRTIDSANCPNEIAKSNASQQSGWMFDLPGSGERMIADRPLIQGGVVTFTTLTPASDPCTGNTVGRMYDIDYKSGGRVSRGNGGVYDLNNDKSIDSSDKFSISALGSSDGNTATWVAPSGKLLIYGASETPLRLRLPDGTGPSGVGGGGSGSPSPGTITSTGGCSDFVAGWGCMSSMGRKPLGGSFMDYVSNQKLDGNGLLPTGGSNIDETAKSIPTLSGRVSWREIMR